MELGIDAVCVTEHDTLEGGMIAAEIGREMGYNVIPAQEVGTQYGDILAFGLKRDNLRGIPVEELYKIAVEDEAVLIAAHPFRRGGFSIENYIYNYGKCFVAIETLNGNCGEIENRNASECAIKLKLQCIGGSDAHYIGMVGRFYTEFADNNIRDIDSLVYALKYSKYQAKENPLYRGR
jgi:hypothetical protein